MRSPGCLVLFLGGLAAVLIGGVAAVAITSGGSSEPQVTSVATAIPQVSTPGVIASPTATPTVAALPTRVVPTSTVQPGGVAGDSGGASATPSGVDAAGPLGTRACTGSWNASLLRPQEEMAANGYTQADVLFDVVLPASPQFELIGEATIEVEQFLSAQIDPADPQEWDLVIDRRGDTPFPIGTHLLALQIRVIDELCEIPLTLVVS
jgi:hypothetical protein